MSESDKEKFHKEFTSDLLMSIEARIATLERAVLFRGLGVSASEDNAAKIDALLSAASAWKRAYEFAQSKARTRKK